MIVTIILAKADSFKIPPAKAGGILNECQAQTEALEVKLFSTKKRLSQI
jgi:hypothetical protein